MPTVSKEDAIRSRLAVVDGKQSDKNHAVLQPVLFDLIALNRVVKQLHWNVTGKHFRALHLHLDEIYAIVDKGVDSVAERMTATGHSPDGRLQQVAKGAEIDDVPMGFLPDDRVLDLATKTIRQTCENIRGHMEKIEDVDVVTADMLHQIVLDLEKHHWMLEASKG